MLFASCFGALSCRMLLKSVVLLARSALYSSGVYDSSKSLYKSYQNYQDGQFEADTWRIIYHLARWPRPVTSSSHANRLQSEQVSSASSATLKDLDKILSSSESLEDSELQNQALSLVEQLRAGGILPAFGAARRIPKRTYTLEDMRLNKVDTTKLLSPTEETLSKVEAQLQAAFAGLVVFTAFYGGFDIGRAGTLVLFTLFLLLADQVGFNGGLRALVTDSAGRILAPQYRERVAYHEAGHFMIAYLSGLLPLAFTLSSLDAYNKYRALNVQAGCRFADTKFSTEVQAGKVTASSLECFTCVALAGISAEYVKYGYAEGGTGDIQQLDSLLKSLQFTQKKADSEVRWAVLNDVAILRRHSQAHAALAEKMASQATVGECIAVLEDKLAQSDDL